MSSIGAIVADKETFVRERSGWCRLWPSVRRELLRALALLPLLLLGGGDGQANRRGPEQPLTRTSYFRSAQGNVLPSVFESDPPTSILDVLRQDLNLRDEKSPERKAMSKKLATGQLVRRVRGVRSVRGVRCGCVRRVAVPERRDMRTTRARRRDV